MNARTKQVYPRDMVAHLWANASQDSARDPSGNMYFSGPTLYSYGSHYAIGYRYETADGGAFYLMNADSNSNTTNKMRYIARRALPGFRRAYFVGGLRSDTFSGQGWRGRFMRDALSQAGRAYEEAAKVSRVSAKRENLIEEAADRMRAAQAVADAVMADRKARPDDRKAARETLATLAKVPAWAEGADNAQQREAATTAAGLLVKDEMRAKMLKYRDRAVSAYNESVAMVSAVPRRSAQRLIQLARDSVNAANEARDIAKRYGFRVPAMPDAPALVRSLEPAEAAEIRAETVGDARRALESAEAAHARRHDSDAGAWHWAVEHGARQLGDAVNDARRIGSPDIIPAAWVERAEHLRARASRSDRLRMASRTVSNAVASIASGDSYAQAGHAADALREYRNASRNLAGLELPATHPAALRLAEMAGERERIAAYIANADELMRRENAQRIEAWRAGGPSLPHSLRDTGPLLRVRGDAIETSWGATVPASIAPRLWRLVNAARAGDAAAVTAKARGLRVGHFTLESVRPDGSIVVGCHDIAFNELQHAAGALGLSNDTTAAA